MREPLRCFLIVSPRPSSPAFYSRLHVHQGERKRGSQERERERRKEKAKEFLTHGRFGSSTSVASDKSAFFWDCLFSHCPN